MNKRIGIAMIVAGLLVVVAGSAFAATWVDGAYIAEPYVPPTVTLTDEGQTVIACPATTEGRGPADSVTCYPMRVYPTCDPVEQAKRCGAFCSAGQQPAGWPYGWCDEYWLRPNTNL